MLRKGNKQLQINLQFLLVAFLSIIQYIYLQYLFAKQIALGWSYFRVQIRTEAIDHIISDALENLSKFVV